MSKTQKITPFLWFDNQAEAAAHFYTAIFPQSSVGKTLRGGDAVIAVDFYLAGQQFGALNGGPRVAFNPSISFTVVCEDLDEITTLWNRLIDGGMALMPLQQYDWSERYGWVQDRFGLSWQLTIGKTADMGQKITPSFLFTGPQRGKAQAALQYYTALFHDAAVQTLVPYGAGGPGPEGSVMYAQFALENGTFIAMDNPNAEPQFTFNEAVSFVVHCDAQEEVDFYWDKLTADGGEESRCSWLKDPFGVSWQIVPEVLPRLLGDPDPAVSQYAMQAMLQMNKIEIAKLTPPPPKTTITVKSVLEVPIEKIWRFWTEPQHIMQWNSASDDWHTPQASNDLRTGGRFVSTMAAKDGSVSFDFTGIYEDVQENRRIAYVLEDGRKVSVDFEPAAGGVLITESFEAENTHPHEMQQAGWQAILDNFKKYAESQS